MKKPPDGLVLGLCLMIAAVAIFEYFYPHLLGSKLRILLMLF